MTIILPLRYAFSYCLTTKQTAFLLPLEIHFSEWASDFTQVKKRWECSIGENTFLAKIAYSTIQLRGYGVLCPHLSYATWADCYCTIMPCKVQVPQGEQRNRLPPPPPPPHGDVCVCVEGWCGGVGVCLNLKSTNQLTKMDRTPACFAFL